MNRIIIAMGAVVCVQAVPASAGWIELSDPYREASLSLWDEVYQVDTSNDGYWSTLLSLSDSNVFGSTSQESEIEQMGLDFTAGTLVEGMSVGSSSRSESSLQVQVALDSTSLLLLGWEFQMVFSGGGMGGVSFRVQEYEDDQALVMDFYQSVSGNGSSSVELNPGIYVVSMLVHSEVETDHRGFSDVAGSIAVDFVIPAPGAFWLLTMPLVMRRRRRSC